jgi:hypothetical protein
MEMLEAVPEYNEYITMSLPYRMMEWLLFSPSERYILMEDKRGRTLKL